jgi:hypothetical protein
MPLIGVNTVDALKPILIEDAVQAVKDILDKASKYLAECISENRPFDLTLPGCAEA